MRVFLSLLLVFLACDPASAETWYRCSCVGAHGRVACGPADFGPDPDGYNVPGATDPERAAEKICRDLNPQLQELRCLCTAN